MKTMLQKKFTATPACDFQSRKKTTKCINSSNSKCQTVKIRDKVVDLKETKDLYGRLMILAKLSRGIGQKNAIGNYEFTVTPRSFFTPNGELLPCVNKSKLIHALEKLPHNMEPKRYKNICNLSSC